MMLKAIDHVVMTVSDIDATIRFYEGVLKTPVIRFGEERLALQIGANKINLHASGKEFEPKAKRPTVGAIDICFLTDELVEDVALMLERAGVPIEVGPVERAGAVHKLNSIYIRDPDGNLVEISNELSESS